MCYTERDSLQTMLIKSGTISQTNVRGGQAEEKDDKKDADKKKKKSTSREKKPDQNEIAAREMLADEESSELASPNKHRRGREHGHERGHEHGRNPEKKDKGVKNTELVSRHHHGAEVV